jgi:molecular chaperone GrpE
MTQDERGTEEPRPAGPAPAGDPPPPVAKASSGAGSPAGSPPGGDSQDSTEQGDGDQVEQDLNALLADAEAKKSEYLELAQRTQADFENYRKRMAAEVQAASLRGKSEVARELIEAVDNLERALESAGESAEGLAGGVEMVLRGMREALARNRIEAVDPKGERFDPTLHEALSTMPVEGTESGTVVEVMQKGYRIDEHLLRPARVVVSA